jgi:hypothetical protein
MEVLERPDGLANVALSLLMERAGARAAAVRRKVLAKQKLSILRPR